jgi:hypothetical protein
MTPRWFALGLAGASVACGDGTGPDLTLANLAGIWTATEISVTNNLEPDLTEDLFAEGVRFQITIEGDGAYAVEFSNPLGSDGYDGSLTVEGDSLILLRSDVPGERTGVHARFESDQLALTWLGTEQCGSYGWHAPTCPIPATFSLTLAREP